MLFPQTNRSRLKIISYSEKQNFQSTLISSNNLLIRFSNLFCHESSATAYEHSSACGADIARAFTPECKNRIRTTNFGYN